MTMVMVDQIEKAAYLEHQLQELKLDINDLGKQKLSLLPLLPPYDILLGLFQLLTDKYSGFHVSKLKPTLFYRVQLHMFK